jgi:hypothetical protein
MLADLYSRACPTIQAVSAVTVAPPIPRTGGVLRMDVRRETSGTDDAVTVSVANTQPAQPAADHSISFHDILSALNPLQYLPVIGTIYRAVTGDQIPEIMRRAGSLVVSTLLGGPIGAVTNLATTMLEKIGGIDVDKTMQAALGGHPSENAPSTASPPTAEAATALLQLPAATGADAAGKPWSPAELAAYGVGTAKGGTLTMAGVTGADVLNTLELKRIQDVNAAYGRIQHSSHPAAGGRAV